MTPQNRLAKQLETECRAPRRCCQNCGSPILSKSEKVFEIIRENPGIRTKALTVRYELRYGKGGGERGITRALELLKQEQKITNPRAGVYYARSEA
jgi:hypothetical protein